MEQGEDIRGWGAQGSPPQEVTFKLRPVSKAGVSHEYIWRRRALGRGMLGAEILKPEELCMLEDH